MATALGVPGLLLMCPPCSCPSEDRRAQRGGRCTRDARLLQLILTCRGDSKECWEPSNSAWKVGAGERTDEVRGGRLQRRSCANPGTLPASSLSTETTSLWSRWDDILPTLFEHFPHPMSSPHPGNSRQGDTTVQRGKSLHKVSADQWLVLTALMACSGLGTSHESLLPLHHLSGSEKHPSPMPQRGK